MTVYISIISHKNALEIIRDLKPHELKTPNHAIILVDNIPEKALEEYTHHHQLNYLANDAIKGFGSNHNQVFRYCQKELGMDLDNDWLVILNPDLECDAKAIATLIEDMQNEHAKIGAPNIFKDRHFQEHEESVRRFPYVWELVTSYLFRKNRTGVDRCTLKACEVDWASGACLAFNAKLFQTLGGFDERYFLYYEDVDICWRARHLLGEKTYYIPGAKMVHKGKRASHTLNNKHLWWHLTSALRFAWVRTKTAIFGKKALHGTPLERAGL